MSDNLLSFFQAHPFWAIFIIVFMILPIAGAVIHIILKAFGRKGIDNSPPTDEPSDVTIDDDEEDHENHTPGDEKK